MGRAAVFAALLALLAPGRGSATTLDEAVALALNHDPGLRRAEAEQAIAQARVKEAEAGRLPTVAIEGSAASARTDFGHFFGFGRYDLTPRSAAVSITQPLFAGGAITAAIDQARAEDAASRSEQGATRLNLVADVAEAFVAVRVTEQALDLRRAQIAELTLVRDQAQRRFDDGASPRTDLDQAEARLAGAQADLAAAQGALARARARYHSLVGEDPAALEPVAALPPTPGSLEEATSRAEAANPQVAAARSRLGAAGASVRQAEAERLPTLGLVAQASTVSDQFLPGYRADGASVGVQGRWTLFSGGAASARIAKARAAERAAGAALDQARAATQEAAIDGWQALQTASAVTRASAAQAKAAEAALYSVRQEVRVGAKPTLDLLNAEREALAAHIGELEAHGAEIVAAYRLNAIVGR
ncbi:TolC family outer membrane protein [Phenylobacterium montanum]|nr:TolC family outer membrane protein [Caulobacter sp. S6]